MSLRERLEAKARRQLVVPVQVSDPSGDREAWLGINAAHTIAESKRGEERRQGEVDELWARLVTATQRLRQHYVDVRLQSLPPADWDAVLNGYVSDEGAVDWPAVLPAVLAECCVDEELRDEEWWRATLASPGWSEGDVDTLRAAVLTLNVAAADPRHIPKG